MAPVSLFLLVSLAHAQPELKVGQEILVIQRNVCGYDQYGARVLKISGDFAELEYVYGSGGGLIELNISGCENFSFGMPMIIKISETEYGTLKPAPRPEFKLPSENYSPKECVYAHVLEKSIPPGCRTYDENDQAIADELRYLREEIEGLK